MVLAYPTFGLDRPRGVSLEKASFYKNDVEFKCLSDGKIIPVAHVNDDYCDCDDGSDEPGTSACPNGLFYCTNKGYKGLYLLSSRVNDGICDCCDGSDEYEGLISCENTCLSLNDAELKQREAFRRNQEQGYKVKQEYIQQGKRQKDEKLSRLSELEREKETLISERDAAQALKEEAEEPEKAALDAHKEKWEEAKAEKQKIKDAETAALAFTSLDVNQDNIVDYPEIMKRMEFDIDSDGKVSEEEAKEYLEEQEQVDVTVFTEKIWPNIKEIYKFESKQETEEPKEETPEETEEEKDPGMAREFPSDDVVEGSIPGETAETDMAEELDENVGLDGDEDYDEEEEEDDEDGLDEDDMERWRESRFNKHKRHLEREENEEDKMPEYDEETKKLIATADEFRKKYDEANRKVQDAEREISDIKKYLEIDFGPDEEFAALKGQCFEYTDREYTYRLCPFDKTTQKPKAGGIETSLGNWGHWHGPAEDKYDAMKYENGQGCWNGPSRSTHVNLHCGPENLLTGASEPSRCEYQFEFTTPARCPPLDPPSSDHVHTEL